MNLKMALVLLALSIFSNVSFAKVIVGVSYDAFHEHRWQLDESAMMAELTKAGAQYLKADAAGSSKKQLTDIDELIAQGAKVLIILARDSEEILPAIKKAADLKIPVIAYDRLIAAAGITYVSFDSKEVGRITASEILKLKPKGNYVIIKGDESDANTGFLREGEAEVLAKAIKKRDVKIVGETFTQSWMPAVAQSHMEKILIKNRNKVDAVIVHNDGMAGAVINVLESKKLKGIPVSGQDGDFAALNRIAKGTQSVSVWKNSFDIGTAAAQAALELANGKAVSNSVDYLAGPKKIPIKAILLKPIGITRSNLDVVLKTHIKKEDLCKDVLDPSVSVCQ